MSEVYMVTCWEMGDFRGGLLKCWAKVMGKYSRKFEFIFAEYTPYFG